MSDVEKRALIVRCYVCGDTVIGAVEGDNCGGCGAVVVDE